MTTHQITFSDAVVRGGGFDSRYLEFRRRSMSADLGLLNFEIGNLKSYGKPVEFCFYLSPTMRCNYFRLIRSRGLDN